MNCNISGSSTERSLHLDDNPVSIRRISAIY
jgi:hypothetical protein